MNSKGKIILITVILVYILLVILSKTGPQTPDWSHRFDESTTNPLDTKILFEQLPSWFSTKKIEKIPVTFYQYAKANKEIYTSDSTNYISISENFSPDKTSVNSLLAFIAQGNTAFISAVHFGNHLKDTLNFQIQYDERKFDETKHVLHLNYTSDSLVFDSKMENNNSYIKDTLANKKLGYYINSKQKKRTNFVGIPFKKGIVYLHTNPEIFTNYQLLKATNFNYINTTLSYIPKEDILFDQVFKRDPDLSNSPLRYILSQPSLRWSWYLALVTLALFLLFNSKRRQRIIPILPVVSNTTTEFVQTVSNLYQESADTNNIIQKKIRYFLEHIRSQYHLSTDKLDEDFINKLARKSNTDLKETEALIQMIVNMKKHHYTTEEPLLRLNKKINEFYKNQ
ncbi:DUF4350 domain-containing protein [Flavicella sediminum]|uniref:DUF4350 domain-containing protein n=1 Tax=Flavicella sediminum TaxID=2585141 RepID=UPI00112258C6|nr:DUF4350 domain-containing protein [Flavicella sediminum]